MSRVKGWKVWGGEIGLEEEEEEEEAPSDAVEIESSGADLLEALPLAEAG